MRKVAVCVLAVIVLLLLDSPPAYAQRSEGRLLGTIVGTDDVPLPGASVTIAAPQMMGSRVAFTGAGGGYRFAAIPPGSYTVTVVLQGFKTVVREDVIVPVGVTITLDVGLELTAVEETIRVVGESPIVDLKSNDHGASFTAENLKEVPTSTDIWAIIWMTPGIRATAYDVGGSHKAVQGGYRAFGVGGQNRVMTEGMDSTESGGGTGFYFDYYSKDDVRVIAASGDVEMTTGGTFVIQNVKSGGNEFHGTILQAYENRSMVGNNIDDATQARGFTGNPNRLFWETHGDVGGPIVADRLWFFGSANAFKIDKVLSGVDPSVATDVGRIFVFNGKVSWRPSDRDQFAGFGYWSTKQKPNRGLSNTRPRESTLPQAGWSRMWNGTWERTWSDSVFTDITAGVMGLSILFIPVVDPVTHAPRQDINTGVVSGAGWGTALLNRYKPQTRGSLYWYTDNSTGTHDLKFGYDWMIDALQFAPTAASGVARYRDKRIGADPAEILIANYPQYADDRNRHTDFFAQDTWTIGNRVTANVGLRFQRQNLYYVDNEVAPVLSNITHGTTGEQIGFPTGLVPGEQVDVFNAIAPRLGVNFDLLGDGSVALKAAWGRYHWNANDDFAGVNPSASRTQLYAFNDVDGNLLWDCDPLHVDVSNGCTSNELGLRLAGSPGSLINSGTVLDPDLVLPYTDELSASMEWQVLDDAAVRFVYVRKSARDLYSSGVNPAREGNLTVNFQALDVGEDGIPGTEDDGILNLRTIPPDAFGKTETILTNYPDSARDADNIQVAYQQRFRGSRAFLLASFDYGWNRYIVSNNNSLSTSNHAPLRPGYVLDLNRDVPRVQDTTTWGFKAAGHFLLPADVGLGINMQVNSGWDYARLATVRFPGIGNQRVFVEPIENNRSNMVPLINVRVDKRVQLPHGTFTLMGDLYNILNSNSVLNFNLRTGSRYNEIIQALDPITFMLGMRYEF